MNEFLAYQKCRPGRASAQYEPESGGNRGIRRDPESGCYGGLAGKRFAIS